jgi:hypothetical protein
MSMITEAPTTPPVGGLPPPLPPPPPPRPQRSRPARGRTLWIVAGSLLLIAALGWGTFNIVDVMAHEERTERFSVPADGLDGLLVDNDNGSVSIVGNTSSEVGVIAEVSEGLRSTEFRHEVVDSTLELHGSCPAIGAIWCRVSWDVEVSRDLAVDIDANNDSVDVVDIDGDVRIDADNGSVELAGLTGSVEVDADNGRVVGTDLASSRVVAGSNNGRVELTFTEVPDLVRATSDNGSIEIVVPAIEGGYSVTADTDNGDIDLTSINNNPESPRTIDVESNNGDVTVRTVERG